MMKHYLVDYENVNSKALRGLDELKRAASVVIFYSDACRNFDLDLLRDLTDSGVMVVASKVELGSKNALDFQLSSYLGWMIGHFNRDDEFAVVSNDTGFDCLVKFWKYQGVRVNRVGSSKTNKQKAR